MKLDINFLEIRILRGKIFDNFHLSISRCDSRLRRRSFLSSEDFRQIFGSKKRQDYMIAGNKFSDTYSRVFL